jgi:DNA (cytosine-5)-methyltransferase 1
MFSVFDLFCGTGGFSQGFEQTGAFQVVAGLDSLEDRIRTFQANHPHAIAFHKNITKFRAAAAAKELGMKQGDLDILIGGPPCQGFSSIRPFRSNNEDDPRNHLFNHFGFYLRHFKPRIFVLENVVGMVSHKNGDAVKKMLSFFEDIGYTVNWAVLNSAYYGLPQRRERVIFIGNLDGKKIQFPEPTHYYNGRSMVNNGTPYIKPLPLTSHLLQSVLTVEDAIGDLPPVKAGEVASHYCETHKLTEYQRARRGNCEQLTLHIATNHTDRMLEIIRLSGTNRSALPDGMTTSGFSTSYSRLDAVEPSVTLTVNFVHPASNKCIHPSQDRALTPREGARIQGFDDSFIFHGSRTQIVKQIGNAVPPLLGQVIAETILKYL